MVPIELLDGELPALTQQVEDSNENRITYSYNGDSCHLNILVSAIGHANPGAVTQPDAFEDGLQCFHYRKQK